MGCNAASSSEPLVHPPGDGTAISSSPSGRSTTLAQAPGILPAVPADNLPVIPEKDRRTNAATAASAASVRALSAQALQFYFRAPVKAFFRTRVDYLAYARGSYGELSASASRDIPAHTSSLYLFRHWLRRTTPGVLALAIRRHGWSVVPDQVLPPLLANIGVAAVLYTSYLHILARLHPESGQARRRVYPPPAPTETFVAGFSAGVLQSVVAAPLDAIQARYDHGTTLQRPQSMWAFSVAKLREIGLRGIFAGWGLSLAKDSIGNGMFFAVFEYVKAQSFYRFVSYYYRAQQPEVSSPVARHLHHHDGQDSLPPISSTVAPNSIRPHYAIEPLFLLLAGVSASFVQQLLLHPLTHFQVVHWDLLEDLDATAKTAGDSSQAGTLSRRRGIIRAYYHAYLQTSRRCDVLAAAEGRSRLSWLYRGFWWNAIRQVPSTSAGLIIFELLRRKYGMADDGVRISQDGYDILLA